MDKQVRQSNFELLRILCMWGVLTCHVINHLYNIHTANFSVANETRVFIFNISIVAVNCFVIISGYFKIKPSWKRIIRLYAQIAFYTALFAGIGLLNGNTDITNALLHTIFPLSHSGMWFITAYFCLFLIAPILNAAFEKANKQERIMWLVALLLVDIYVGYIHQAPQVTQDGYHIIHFITLYFLGRYISCSSLKIKNGGFFVAIVLLMTVLHGVKMIFPPIAVIYSMRYNSPCVMIASVVFFLWARTWKVQSRAINFISASVLSVYIIHSQPVVSKFFFGNLKNIVATNSALIAGIMVISSMLALYLICILLDKVRIAMIDPIADKLSDKLKLKFSCFNK